MKTEARQYKDVEGNHVTLDWLVKNEPEWAANQIRHRDRLDAGMKTPIETSVPNGGSLHLVVVSRLINQWRVHAKESERDLGAAIDCDSRARLSTEARILKRCARQLEQGLARHMVEM